MRRDHFESDNKDARGRVALGFTPTVQPPAALPAPFQFSIVTAVYNVAQYLDEFIDSIEAQSYPRDRFEVIAVDDGSTDESATRLREWQEQRPGLVTILSHENRGLASARNTGLAVAKGRWVTFTDPDDVVADDYLSEVAAFIDQHPTAVLVGANLLILDDTTGAVTDTHPLRRRFAAGNRICNLDKLPDALHVSAPAAFFCLEEVHRQRLEFDPRVRPTFEDAHFATRYLLGCPEPIVGLVATAEYRYRRRRRDAGSILQRSPAEPGRFTTVLRYGYLDLLRRGAEQSEAGHAPEWIQNLVLYELSWLLSIHDTHAGTPIAVAGPVAAEFHALLADILGYLSPELIRGFRLRTLKPAWTAILLHGYRPASWHSPVAHVSQLDVDQRLVRVSYLYTGERPHEMFLSDGEPVSPVHAKTRDIAYYERVLAHERIAWLPADRELRVRLGTAELDLRFSIEQPTFSLSPATMRRELGSKAPAARVATRRLRIRDRIVRRLSRTRIVRRFFGDAWVLMDRITNAGDSAERLFAFLRDSRPEINAWFVIEAGNPDWQRLRKAGHRRVIPHGSLRWKLLMLNCQHLVSSHLDVPIIRPAAIVRIREPRWRFTFLQHGVIKDDLSNWLNTKRIDLMITSTPQEHASITADHTPYVLTTREVKMTGLPLFDRLLEIGGRVGTGDRDLVLMAPTWRVQFAPLVQQGSHHRRIDPSFFESEVLDNWLGLLRSPALAAVAEELGLTVAFLPHPDLQPAVPDLDLPAHVRPFTFADAQELFARSAVLVTDYSSMAFNAAYINRPVVYFQFDREAVLSGSHLGRRGYFDYERDGFGPLTTTLPEAIEAIVATLRAGRNPEPEYQRRIDAAFPARDGLCCARVVDAVVASAKPAAEPVHVVPA